MEKSENKKSKSSKEYMSNFYSKHPEKRSEKIMCELCGGEYTYNNKSKHMKTKRHLTVAEFIKMKNI